MSRTVWRLTKAKYADSAFSGYGSTLRAGRWHRRGTPVVYAAESPALALLEALVHTEDAALLSFEYTVLSVRLDAQHVAELEAETLPVDWKAWPWPASTQRLGMQWFEERRSVALRVPSAVVPRLCNVLLNPLHPDFGALETGVPEPFPMDPRLAGD